MDGDKKKNSIIYGNNNNNVRPVHVCVIGTRSVHEGGGGGGIVIRFRDKRLPPTRTADKISWHWYTACDLPGAFLGASRDPYRERREHQP